MNATKRLAKLLLTVFLFIAVSFPGSAQKKITVALWGDSRENLDNACEDIALVLLHSIKDWDIQVHTGDFTHDGSEQAWQRTLQFKGINELFANGRILMCTSNHDAEQKVGSAENKRANWDKHTAHILPTNDEDNTTHYYAWHKENVHIVFCDGYFTDSTTMQRWLDRYLENVKPDDWLIAVWHNPAFDLTYKETYLPTCRKWVESLERHGGDFIFNGHAHVYLRTKPLSSDGIVNESKGIVHIINGTGGASWKDPVPPDPRIAYTPSTRSFASITFLTFVGNTVTLRTVDARPGNNLQVIDEWYWTKPHS